MKILSPFVGDSVGGSHQSSALLLQELGNLNIETVVVVHQPGPLTEFFDERDIPYSLNDLPFWHPRGGILKRTLRLAVLIPQLLRVLRRCRPEVVHVHDGRMAISWAIPCWLMRIPLVIHQRNRFVSSRAYDLALVLADRVIAISEFTLKSLPIWARRKSEIVFNPFHADNNRDRKLLKEQIKLELGIDQNSQILIFVGNEQEQKRPLIALQALVELHRSDVNAVLIMAGKITCGGQKIITSFIEQERIRDSVKIIGFRNDIQRYVAAADVLIAPAVNEGHGRSLVEAMMAGTPIVVSASGGHPEIVNHDVTGLLFQADNASALSRTVQGLLRNPNYAETLASNARAFALETYSVNKHASKVFAIYRRVIGRVAIVIEGMGGGGSQQVVSQLLSHWKRRGDNPVLVTFTSNYNQKVFIPSEIESYFIGLPRVSNGLLQATIFNIVRAWRLRRAIKKSGVSRVVSFVTATNVLTIFANLFSRTKVIVSERNDPERQHIGICWSLLRRLLYPLAWRVSANTQVALDFFSSYISPKRLALVPNPIREGSGAFSEASEPPFILSVGRLHPQKNYPVLFRAFATAALSGWRLRILGDGFEREKLIDLASELEIEDRVDFMGYVADPFPHYRAARLFVLASDHEGSPNALWEAMSVGLPVLVSDSVTGAYEICQESHSVRFFRNGDSSSLAKQLMYMGKTSIVMRRSRSNAQLISEKFSRTAVFRVWDKVIF